MKDINERNVQECLFIGACLMDQVLKYDCLKNVTVLPDRFEKISTAKIHYRFLLAKGKN